MLNFNQFVSYNLNECTIIAKPMNDRFILYKQRDASSFSKTKVIHEISEDNIELVYYFDIETSWIEGMNEYGIGLINSRFSQSKDQLREPKDWYKPIDFSNYKKEAEKDEYIYNILSKCKNIEDAFNYIWENKNLHGSTLLSNGKILYEIEITDDWGSQYKKYDILDKTNLIEPLIVKTNHGILIPDVGYQEYPNSTMRHSSEIRKIEAERYLTNKKINDPIELFSILSFQPYEKDSMMNILRTNTDFIGVDKCCMDLINLSFYYDPINNYFGYETSIENPKIKIQILNDK